MTTYDPRTVLMKPRMGKNEVFVRLPANAMVNAIAPESGVWTTSPSSETSLDLAFHNLEFSYQEPPSHTPLGRARISPPFRH